MSGQQITKAERAELASLIRKREKVMKTEAEKRSAQLLARFEEEIAAIYSFDDDEIWQKAHQEADRAVLEARQLVAIRCEELGIPKEFAPDLSLSWHGRGQNAMQWRQAELRRVAKSRISQIERDARAKIERMSLDAQTELVSTGLNSDAAKAFLEKVSVVEDLMPVLDPAEVTQLIEDKRKKQFGYE